MIKFREHRGTFQDSMSTLVTKDSKEEMKEYLQEKYGICTFMRRLFDDREGWNDSSFSVFQGEGFAFGYCNTDLNSIK